MVARQSAVGGFQAMTQDALTVLNDVPFSIPPYFALIARAVVTLEGLALIGDPDYGLIMEAYPFVARKLLRSPLGGAARSPWKLGCGCRVCARGIRFAGSSR